MRKGLSSSSLSLRRLLSSSTSGVLPRGKNRNRNDLQVGDKLHGFVVCDIQDIPDFSMRSFRLEHISTGAKYLHLECDDTNNTFAVSLKTLPTDSTGVAHILEHTALCGSNKYPVRDPFFNMTRRSLNTYMNALTGSDFTMYPFCTQNPTDFSNLLSVYVDAVFFPLLRSLDFQQEGHRLEFESLSDPSSRLTISGVVYNEMKGAMSDPANCFGLRLQQKLFPSNTYANNSGGEPEKIPDLSHEMLVNFHKKHYHPSNAIFFTYGDLPLSSHLHLINEALSPFKKQQPPSPILPENKWIAPRRDKMACPLDPNSPSPDRQTRVAVSWVCDFFNNNNNLGEIIQNNNNNNNSSSSFSPLYDEESLFNMTIASSLILYGPNAPMYKSLVEGVGGGGYVAGTGFDTSTLQPTFTVGLQGVKLDGVERIESTIFDTLEKAAKEGLDKNNFEAVAHQVELSLRHSPPDFGLRIALSALPVWQHGRDPLQVLQDSKMIRRLREKMEKKRVLEELIETQLISNPHRVTLVMTPEESFESKMLENEEKLVFHLQQKKNDDKKIVEESERLMEEQMKEQDVSVLPTLTVKDLDRNALRVHTETKTISATPSSPPLLPLQLCPYPSHGVVYWRMLLDVTRVRGELLPFLPIFSSLLCHLGADDLDYRALSHQIEMKTGGISSRLLYSPSPFNPREDARVLFDVSSHFLAENTEEAMKLVGKIFRQPHFSNAARIHLLLNRQSVSISSSLAAGSSRIERGVAAGLIGGVGSKMADVMGGATHADNILSIVPLLESSAAAGKSILENIFQEILEAIRTSPPLRISLTGDEHILPPAEAALRHVLTSFDSPQGEDGVHRPLSSFPLSSSLSSSPPPSSPLPKIFIPLPSQVHNVSACVTGPPLTHADAPLLALAGRIMSAIPLHRSIREQGGAYGSGAGYSESGLFSFMSFRDPNCDLTLTNFDNAVRWILNEKGNNNNNDDNNNNNNASFSLRNLDEAKLSIISDLDTPIGVAGKGQSKFAHSLTDEMRQQYRERILDATMEDIKKVTENYLFDKILTGKAAVAVAGPAAGSENLAGNWEKKKIEELSLMKINL